MHSNTNSLTLSHSDRYPDRTADGRARGVCLNTAYFRIGNGEGEGAETDTLGRTEHASSPRFGMGGAGCTNIHICINDSD